MASVKRECQAELVKLIWWENRHMDASARLWVDQRKFSVSVRDEGVKMKERDKNLAIIEEIVSHDKNNERCVSIYIK
jgi:hypothetical protein